jgi:hypothetical protein
LQIPAETGLYAQHLGDDQNCKRIAEAHEQADEDMRHRRRNGNPEHQETLACTQGSRNVVIGAVHASDTRPGENRDRKAGGERNEKDAGAKAGREHEEGDGQPGCRRQRSNEPQNRVDPITGEPRPSDRHPGHEPGRCTEKIAGREQTS